MIDAATRIKRNEALVTAELDGETVMMDIANGSYFGLNGTGTVIWEGLEAPATLADLTAKVGEAFAGAEGADVAADVATFVYDLVENGLVLIDD